MALLVGQDRTKLWRGDSCDKQFISDFSTASYQELVLLADVSVWRRRCFTVLVSVSCLQPVNKCLRWQHDFL